MPIGLASAPSYHETEYAPNMPLKAALAEGTQLLWTFTPELDSELCPLRYDYAVPDHFGKVVVASPRFVSRILSDGYAYLD